METKQTAVEWLIEHSHIIPKDIPKMELLEQAKKMEKEQIKDAWKDSSLHRFVEEVLEYSAEEYYIETYGTN